MATKICKICGREINCMGSYMHEKHCNGDPDRLLHKTTIKTKKGVQTRVNEDNTIPPHITSKTDVPVNPGGPEIHTTVPLNPSTNEHGGIIKSNIDPEPKESEQTGDNDDWDGYLC